MQQERLTWWEQVLLIVAVPISLWLVIEILLAYGRYDAWVNQWN